MDTSCSARLFFCPVSFLSFVSRKRFLSLRCDLFTRPIWFTSLHLVTSEGSGDPCVRIGCPAERRFAAFSARQQTAIFPALSFRSPSWLPYHPLRRSLFIFSLSCLSYSASNFEMHDAIQSAGRLIFRFSPKEHWPSEMLPLFRFRF